MLYIIYVDLFSRGYLGIKKKVFSQIKIFEKEFGRVYYTTYSGQMMYLMLGSEVLEKDVALTRKECNMLVVSWIEKYSVTMTYIRYSYSNMWFIDYLKWQKDKNIKSVLEFPTVPYDGELSNKRLLAEDRYYRGKMAGYINQCTTYSDFDEVFGIPCIPLLNGVDTKENPVRKCREKDGTIVLLAVASMAGWHGYERIIEGLAGYYKEDGRRNILFKLVGEGPETSRYKKLVENYGLGQHVQFCGKLEGRELDRQYDEADIAAGVLGCYKKNICQGAPIKTAEYCSRGIPFIYGYHDTGLGGSKYYALEVPNDSQRIGMDEVIRFYESIGSFGLCAEEMHSFAVKRYTWDVVLKPVLDYYNRQGCH